MNNTTTALCVVPVEELKSIVADAVKAASSTNANDEILDVKEVAALLKCSVSHVYSMGLPSLNCRPIRYSKRAIMEHLNGKK